MVDFTGATNSWGIANIGALMAFGGKVVNGTNTYSKNIVVANCLFYNPSSIGIWLGYTSDVLITNCSFSYFNGISTDLAKTLRGWCGILSQSSHVVSISSRRLRRMAPTPPGCHVETPGTLDWCQKMFDPSGMALRMDMRTGGGTGGPTPGWHPFGLFSETLDRARLKLHLPGNGALHSTL